MKKKTANEKYGTMIKKIIALMSLGILVCLSCTAQDVNYEWARTYGNSGDGSIRNMVVDNSGNIYSVGSFQGSVDFDPGPGTANVSIGGSALDGYIQKLDSNGNFVWVRAYFAPNGSIQSVMCQSITLDDSSNIYVVGTFNGTVDFDYGPGVKSVTSTGYGIFILKLDSAGNFIWVKDLGTTGATQRIGDVKFDSDGFICTIGYHLGDLDVDPGPNVVKFSGNGGFLLKLDLEGNFVSASQFKGDSLSNGYAYTNSLVIDSLHNVYVTGIFGGTVDFDPDSNIYNLSSNGDRDCFVVKINSTGGFEWAKAFGGRRRDVSKWIALDPFDGVYIGGGFFDTVDFNTGPGVLNAVSKGEDDIFIVKLDTAGNFNWVKTFGSASFEYASAISTDGAGNSYTIGRYSDSIDFDPGLDIHSLIPDSLAQLFVLKLDSAGDFVWAKRFEGTIFQEGYCIYTNYTSDEILIGGNYRNFIDFDPGIDTALFIAPKVKENFLLKLSQCTIRYGIDSISACKSYTWIDGITYTSNNNTATHLLSNGSYTGCDSIVRLYLNITNIDASATLQGNIIKANAQGVFYQWLDCADNYIPIVGEKNDSFMPLVNGLYAVEVSSNNCTDTSDCVLFDMLSVFNNSIEETIKIYPNPNAGVVNIDINGVTDFALKIYSINGKLVYDAKGLKGDAFSLTIDVESGVYLIELVANDFIHYKRLIVL